MFLTHQLFRGYSYPYPNGSCRGLLTSEEWGHWTKGVRKGHLGRELFLKGRKVLPLMGWLLKETTGSCIWGMHWSPSTLPIRARRSRMEDRNSRRKGILRDVMGSEHMTSSGHQMHTGDQLWSVPITHPGQGNHLAGKADLTKGGQVSLDFWGLRNEEST